MALLKLFEKLGDLAIYYVNQAGRMGIFLFNVIINILKLPYYKVSHITKQIYVIGALSIFVIIFTGAFTGMVLGLQGYNTLKKFSSEGLLGSAVALSLIRELGPVLTALMVTGRAGSAICAEIGIMRNSEQIDALETMDINPLRFLISPKIAAALVCFPLLTALFDVIGIFGGYLTGSMLLGIDPGIYLNRVESSVVMKDIAGGFYKSLVFAVVVVTMCCFQGYYTHKRTEGFGAKGVSLSTTSAVVISSVLVLIVDYVMTSFLI